MMNSSAIDAATFDALRETTGAEFVRELADAFLAEAPQMLGDLRQSLAAMDAERFRRAAHSLKSNGSTFGALELADIARDLELSGVAQVSGRGPQALAAVEAEYARTAAALKDLRNG
jgi:histidine phosphotransfer protein HptB